LYYEVYGSTLTAAHFVNGCGPQDPSSFASKLANYKLNTKAIEQQIIFESACNAHDVCYACGLTENERNECDKLMYENMIDICSTLYPNVRENAEKYEVPTLLDKLRFGLKFIEHGYLSTYIPTISNSIINGSYCLYWAKFYSEGVTLGGKDAFNDKKFDPSRDCAMCGLPIVYNTLSRKPFYIKPDSYSEELIENLQCTYEKKNGLCKKENDCNSDSNDIVYGLCPLASLGITCCIPKEEEVVPINTPCFDRGGQCTDPNNCDGTVETGLCSGGDDKICCLPKKEADDDSQCTDLGDQCTCGLNDDNSIKTYKEFKENYHGHINAYHEDIYGNLIQLWVTYII